MTPCETIEEYWMRHTITSYEGYLKFCECHGLETVQKPMYDQHVAALDDDWLLFCSGASIDEFEAYEDFL